MIMSDNGTERTSSAVLARSGDAGVAWHGMAWHYIAPKRRYRPFGTGPRTATSSRGFRALGCSLASK
jgi:hypothetical protein